MRGFEKPGFFKNHAPLGQLRRAREKRAKVPQYIFMDLSLNSTNIPRLCNFATFANWWQKMFVHNIATSAGSDCNLRKCWHKPSKKRDFKKSKVSEQKWDSFCAVRARKK